MEFFIKKRLLSASVTICLFLSFAGGVPAVGTEEVSFQAGITLDKDITNLVDIFIRYMI